MNSINQNMYYILIPFFYEKEKNFDKYIIDSIGQDNLHEEEIDADNLLLGFIDELFDSVRCYRIPDSLNNEFCECEKLIYYFNTKMGFFVYRIGFSNEIGSEDQIKTVNGIISQINNDNYEDFIVWKQKLAKVMFFPDATAKECLMYSFLIGENNRAASYFPKEDNANEIDKLHSYYIDSNRLDITTNQKYKDLIKRDEDIQLENKFRNKYEYSFFLVFLLLQHERQMYFWLRKQVVVSNKNRKNIRVVKDRIIDLLARYSYTIVSEDKRLSVVYSSFRETLMLSEYESSLSDLVFKLDEETEKEKERRMKVVSGIVGFLGVMQIISTIIDIINFLQQ